MPKLELLRPLEISELDYEPLFNAKELTAGSACPPIEENFRFGKALAYLGRTLYGDNEIPDYQLLNEHSALCTACAHEVVTAMLDEEAQIRAGAA